MKHSPLRGFTLPALLALGGVAFGALLARHAMLKKAGEEVPSPADFSEVRSRLAPTITTIDWLYTLRAYADYEGIANSQHVLGVKINALITALTETDGSPDTVNTLFCDTDGELLNLRTKLAIREDATQGTVDSNNETVLNNIQNSLNQVKEIWTNSSGATVHCEL